MRQLKNNLMLFLDYCERTVLTSADGIEEAGSGKDYYNSEMWTQDVVKSLIDWTDGKQLRNSIFLPSVNQKINLLKHLKEKATDHKNFLICEVGRGIEILLTMHCNQELESIVCFDRNCRYGELINSYFNDKRIVFLTVITNEFDLNLAKPETLLIRCHGNTKIDRYLECEKITTAIINGDLLKEQTASQVGGEI